MQKYRIPIIIAFAFLAVGAGYFTTQLKASFEFEQFFPKGDPDLAFFQDFIKNFEADDNFQLIAVVREEGVFDSTFLEQFHALTLDCRDLPYVEDIQSLTKFSYPLKTPFGVTTVPAIHRDQPERYSRDSSRIMQDERFVHNFINEDATTLLIFLKTKANMSLAESREMMAALNDLEASYNFEKVHYLGRPYFTKELVAMQFREIIVSAVVSGILVTLILFFIFRRFWGVVVSLVSVGLGMLLFMGLMGALGRELTAISALYPVLMIIVGTSDVIHIMSKYVDELRKGKEQMVAIRITIREIGLATLLTSITTAIGFATLLSSRIGPIRDFGINAAMGVMVAYITVLLFTTALLSYFKTEQIIKLGRGQAFWDNLLQRCYLFTLAQPKRIGIGAFVILGLSVLGISMITTNYSIIHNMPRGRQITEDFLFFENELTGFRPIEFAIFVKGDNQATDYSVLQEIDKLENYLHQFSYVQAVASVTAIYKSINQMYGNNRPEAYQLPDTEAKYRRYHRMAKQVPQLNTNILVSKDGQKARVTSRIHDIGAENIKAFGLETDAWVASNIDTNLISVHRTGTGLIIDKNSEYVRRSLLLGLGLAIIIVSLLMALLFRNWKMLLISIVPNIFPLILGGALLGFIGIELEAGVSIVFAVIFGIAVDDTIHFLSKYKLAKDRGVSMEEAINQTFRETGKAIVLTSLVLFFGFLVMLFSIHPPSVTIGLLISLTLVSARLSDLLLIPPLLRWLMK